MSQKILVTGGAGYIGSHTVDALIKAGFSVVIVDDLSTGFQELVHPKAKFYLKSILDQESMTKILQQEKIEGIIHFAAKIAVPESVEEPLKYYHNNTMGVISVLEAAKASGVRYFVFSSTAAVYGNSLVPLITEETPPAPINPYGFSKLMSEQIIKDCEQAFGLKSVILRYFNVAGASESLKYGQLSKNATHLIKLAAEVACGKKSSINITGTDYNTPDGTGVRDYIHVEDLADIHVLALKHVMKENKNHVFNCSYGKGSSVKEVIRIMKKVSSNDFQVNEAPRRLGDAESLIADNKKVKSTLNWQPKRDDLELICKSAYEWEKKI
jgi:UDP-glucose 4-epimerase